MPLHKMQMTYAFTFPPKLMHATNVCPLDSLIRMPYHASTIAKYNVSSNYAIISLQKIDNNFYEITQILSFMPA
jgi:hypothetical protein